MLKDAKLELQASTTKTAAFDGTGIDLGTGTAMRGMVAQVLVTAVTTGGAETYQLDIEHSDDDATYTDLATFDFPTGADAGSTGEYFRTFRTPKQYVRLSLKGIAGASPSMTYSGYIGNAEPV